jgi:hypothetical protein
LVYVIENNTELFRIYQAVLKENSNKKSKFKIYMTEDWTSCVGSFNNILDRVANDILTQFSA